MVLRLLLFQLRQFAFLGDSQRILRLESPRNLDRLIDQAGGLAIVPFLMIRLSLESISHSQVSLGGGGLSVGNDDRLQDLLRRAQRGQRLVGLSEGDLRPGLLGFVNREVAFVIRIVRRFCAQFRVYGATEASCIRLFSAFSSAGKVLSDPVRAPCFPSF